MHFGDEAERRRKAQLHTRHTNEIERRSRVHQRRWYLLPIVPALAIGLGLVVVSQLRPATLPNQAQPMYFRNCAEAHAAGYYSISRGNPGYRAMLDADADGLACEPLPIRR